MSKAEYDDDGFRLDPRHLRPTWANRLNNAGEPNWWFYEDAKGIDIFYQTPGGAVIGAAIPKKWLLEYARVASSVCPV